MIWSFDFRREEEASDGLSVVPDQLELDVNVDLEKGEKKGT